MFVATQRPRTTPPSSTPPLNGVVDRFIRVSLRRRVTIASTPHVSRSTDVRHHDVQQKNQLDQTNPFARPSAPGHDVRDQRHVVSLSTGFSIHHGKGTDENVATMLHRAGGRTTLPGGPGGGIFWWSHRAVQVLFGRP